MGLDSPTGHIKLLIACRLNGTFEPLHLFCSGEERIGRAFHYAGAHVRHCFRYRFLR
jgi:hypothetical protein